jgi:hypothetical protein
LIVGIAIAGRPHSHSSEAVLSKGCAMIRERCFASVRTFVACAVVLLSGAVSAQAAPITLEFSGSIDLSSEGGPALNTFNGSITWNPASLPFEVDPDFAVYDPMSYSLIFNGVDVSAPVIGDGTGSGIVIGDDSDIFGTGVGDTFAFFLSFELPFNLASTGDNELNFLGVLTGPATMFSSQALPGDLGFLTQLTNTQSLFFFDAGGDVDEFIDATGPLDVTAVPEPTLLTMTALGAAGALARARRRQPRRS